MIAVCLTGFRVVVVAVVRLVGQSEARLHHVHEVSIGLLGVGVDVETEESADAVPLQTADAAGEFVGRRDRFDGFDLTADRTDPECLDVIGVHERPEEITDLLGVGAARRIGLGTCGDDVADVLFGTITQHVERSVDRTVVGDLVGIEPLAVDVGEQVVLDADGIVDPLEVDAGRKGIGLRSSHDVHPVTPPRDLQLS